MAITPTAADPYGLGTDIALLGDLNSVWGLVSGFTCLGYALARRFGSDLGSLAVVGDAAYGGGGGDLVNADLTPAQIPQIQARWGAQALLDERVQTCRVVIALNDQTSSLSIIVSGTTASGAAFQFIMAATGVTVALLSVNGAPVSSSSGATTASQQTTGSGVTIVISGGGGGPGPPGPPGPGGGAQMTINLSPNGYGADLTTGAETVVEQIDVNIGALAASVTAEMVAAVNSQSGTAVMRVRVGGGDRTVDGSIVATLNASSTSFTVENNGSTFTNPNGLVRVKITIQPSASGQDAQIDGGATVTFR
ncbi:MAG TPA: hypothetical protein VHG72_21965 [Polyangia bacterium]|nr:hypothetical protein [Polyangia bacterium]